MTGEAPSVYKFPKECKLFIDRFYKMDPSSEDLLFDGTCLRDGMTVAVGDSSLRLEISDDMDAYAKDQGEILNSWYTISYTRTSGRYVTFMATYENGYKRKVTYPIQHPWLVKLISIYKTDDLDIDPIPQLDSLGLPNTQVIPVYKTDDPKFTDIPLPSRHGI